MFMQMYFKKYVFKSLESFGSNVLVTLVAFTKPQLAMRSSSLRDCQAVEHKEK